MDIPSIENYTEAREDLFERITPYIGSNEEKARIYIMITDTRFSDEEIYKRLIVGCKNDSEEIADYLGKYELTEEGINVKRPFFIEP